MCAEAYPTPAANLVKNAKANVCPCIFILIEWELNKEYALEGREAPDSMFINFEPELDWGYALEKEEGSREDFYQF